MAKASHVKIPLMAKRMFKAGWASVTPDNTDAPRISRWWAKTEPEVCKEIEELLTKDHIALPDAAFRSKYSIFIKD